jgi:DNA-binding transcriptional LysR family regulator
MARKLTTGVPYFEHPAADRLGHLNWEAIRVFLVLERAGSLRGAAATLGLAINTVRRHLDILEKDVGAVLIKRGYDGIELTREGREFSEAVSPMQLAALDAQRIARRGFSPLSGFVRISVTEGIGTFWVMPRLVEFQRAHPRMVIELNCTMRPADLVKMEADVSIQITRPTDPAMKAVRIGRMHATFFAAQDYLTTYGRPTSIEEMTAHKVVEQLSPQVQHQEYDRLFPGKARDGFVSVVTNTSTAHYWAVAKGAGIGMLPTYLWAIGARVEPVDVGYHTSYDIWLVYHPESRRIRRVSVTIDWLRGLFDPKEFPWFRDDYLAPQQLEDAVRTSRVRDQFDVFSGAVRAVG